MKKSVVVAILGVGVLSSAYGQGTIGFSNYQTPPYNQVVWDANPAFAPTPEEANQAVSASHGLQFQLFYGEGTISDPALLTAGQIFQLATGGASGYDPGVGHGAGGYFINVIQNLPTWASGDIFTFMYKVVDDQMINDIPVQGQSILWQESARIVPDGQPPLPMGTVPGLVVALVPEPSSLALFGIGSLAMVLFRRRQ